MHITDLILVYCFLTHCTKKKPNPFQLLTSSAVVLKTQAAFATTITNGWVSSNASFVVDLLSTAVLAVCCTTDSCSFNRWNEGGCVLFPFQHSCVDGEMSLQEIGCV